MSPSKTNRQAILNQKIEALLELAKLAPVQAEGLKTRSIHTLIASDSKWSKNNHLPLDAEALERSFDYFLSLLKSRIDPTRT